MSRQFVVVYITFHFGSSLIYIKSNIFFLNVTHTTQRKGHLKNSTLQRDIEFNIFAKHICLHFYGFYLCTIHSHSEKLVTTSAEGKGN